MSRPTVLHCARDFVRPSETFVVGLVAGVRETKAVVACRHRWPEVAAVRDLTGVPVHALSGWPGGQRSERALLAAVAVARRARLLHAHFGYWAGVTGRVAHRLRRPWVLSLHGHDLLVEDAGHPDRDVLRRADVVIVPSRFLAAAAVRAGFDPSRVRVIPSGVDVDAVAFRERTAPTAGLTVTFAGRFVEKKGVLDAVAALAAAQQQLPELRARLVGFGPLEEAVRHEVAATGLAAEIVPGDAPGAVAGALAATDLLVVPSRTAADGDAESLGLVAVEAQAAGVPVVATRHGGLPEAVHPDAAVFVDEADVAGMTAAVVALARTPERWAAMGRAGREHVVRSFTSATQTAAVEEVYAELLSRPVSGR